jgi:hypothetical protein
VVPDLRIRARASRLPQWHRDRVLGAFLVMVLALGFRILTTASIEGVVNAPILLIQSPIDGTITITMGPGSRQGQQSAKAKVLCRIENERLDTDNLDRVRSEEEQSQAAASGLKILEQEYTQKRSALGVRSASGLR